MTDTQVAVVGCGYWGQNLVRTFHELGVLSAICDANIQQAKKISTLYNNVPILTMDEIATSSQIKGVVIASPAALHATHIKKFILAGKHVFVEKPLALNLKDAQELQLLAQHHQRILMVGHLLQYHPAYLKIKELIQNGSVGKIRYVYSNRLNLGKVRTEEDVLWSFAPHDISMILGLIPDAITQVKAVASNYLTSGINDFTTVNICFDSQVKAHIFVSWLHPFKEQKLVVVGEKMMLVFDDTQPWESKLQHYMHQVDIKEGIPELHKASAVAVSLTPQEPLKLECQHFIDCIQQQKEPRTNAQEAIRVLKVLSQAQASIEQSSSSQPMHEPSYFQHESSYVDEGVMIGAGTKIWHFSHILKGVTIGCNTIISQNVMIGPDVTIGSNCKIQNNVSLYNGVTLEDGVFCGPSCVFTNVNNPRAEIERKNEYRKTHVGKWATIGANATIVCGVTLGEYSFVGAGAVVTKNVAPYALVVGNPARQIGWMSQAGERLDEKLICPRTKDHYKIVNNQLIKIEE